MSQYKRAPRERKMKQTLAAISPLLPEDAPELVELTQLFARYLSSQDPLYGHIHSKTLNKYIVYELPVDKKYNIVVRISEDISFTTDPI